jgi:hypothetical protein
VPENPPLFLCRLNDILRFLQTYIPRINAFAGKHPKPIRKGTKAAATEAAVTVAEAVTVADLEETDRLAAQFEALGGGALTMAHAQEVEPRGHLRECCLAHERLRVPKARSANRAEKILVRAVVFFFFLEASGPVGAASSAETATAAGAAAKAAAEALGAQAALAPELPKEPCGGADGMAEDGEELPVGPSREAPTILFLTAAGGKRRRWTWLKCWGTKARTTPRPSPSWASSPRPCGWRLRKL